MSVHTVAAIDCGTNSIRLLVSEQAAADAPPRELVRLMEIVRLGQDIDRTGAFAPEALQRTFAAAERYAQVIRELNVDTVRFVATSASRDAANREEFYAGINRILGVLPEVISGQEEAQLSFAGATSGLSAAGPYLMVDIGGGSTEFAFGTTQPEAAISVNMGCVRLYERHLHSDPPSEAERQALLVDVERELQAVDQVIPWAKVGTLVAVAGTATTVAAVALGLASYDPAAIHHSQLSAEGLAAVSRQLSHCSRAERAALGAMHPGRVDVIASGALILAAIEQRYAQVHPGRSIVVSEHDILDGIIAELYTGLYG